MPSKRYAKDPMQILIERQEKNPECSHCLWSIGRYELWGEQVCAHDKPMRKTCNEFSHIDLYRQRLREYSR